MRHGIRARPRKGYAGPARALGTRYHVPMSASVLPVLIHAEEEARRELPMPAELYGILALVVFILLLLLLWSFRGTAYKVRDKHAHQPGGGHH